MSRAAEAQSRSMKRKRGALPYTRGLFVYDENIPFLLEALKGPKIELELQLCEQHKAVCAPVP